MAKPIKVVDLFAGPGGLGEGFSAYRANNEQAFRIAVSIEKEESAHRTLQLRALFRQFAPNKVPEAYYAFLRGELGKHPEDVLYRLPELREVCQEAEREAQKLTLGEDSERTVYKKIRDALNSEDCVLIGGPPCQAYSLVGRSRNYGAKDKQYSASEDHRNFLYLEYLKIIAKFQPLVFVMENVKGMLSAKVDGKLIFHSIRSDLQDPLKATKVKPDKGRSKHRYRIYSFVPQTGNLTLFSTVDCHAELQPKDFIIRAEEFGVPQARHRVILLGIREDIASGLRELSLLKRAENPVTVKQVIRDLPKLRSRLSKLDDSAEAWKYAVGNPEKSTLAALSKDSKVPNEVYRLLQNQLANVCNTSTGIGATQGVKKHTKISNSLPGTLRDWYRDERLGPYIVNHESRGHIVADLHRYIYYSVYASVKGESPNSHNLPTVLYPNHANFSSGKFADRFRVQLADKPGTTVTSHISKDGHYFIHYDPGQCRSLTVREAARIQTFPDNYFFAGNRTQQYVQVGNAVPPYLARQLAEIVAKIII